MSNLYIIATPIGNLKDITLRALEVLKEVDIIAAEDTRVTRKLLNHYHISKPLISYREQVHHKALIRILTFLKQRKSVALLSDAGTPAISDPGYWLIRKVIEEGGITVIPIPGPSALSTMISVSDIDLTRFSFLGFPPHKKGRKKFFALAVLGSKPAMFFESPHRIQKTLSELRLIAADRYVNIGHELTKIHEEVFRGTVSEASEYFVGERKRGEFIIVLEAGRVR